MISPTEVIVSTDPDRSESAGFKQHARLYQMLTDPTLPVLGRTDDNILAPDFTGFLQNPSSIMAEIRSDNKLIGFSVAIPMTIFDVERNSESDPETAYLYATVIDKPFQNQGLVGILTDSLLIELRKRGFRYVERDCKEADGYAGKVEKHFTKSGSIVHSHSWEGYPESGPEMNFLIDIDKYLEWLSKQKNS